MCEPRGLWERELKWVNEVSLVLPMMKSTFAHLPKHREAWIGRIRASVTICIRILEAVIQDTISILIRIITTYKCTHVALCRRRWTDAIRLVCLLPCVQRISDNIVRLSYQSHVHRIRVDFTIYSHGLDAQFPRGTNYATCNFSSVIKILGWEYAVRCESNTYSRSVSCRNAVSDRVHAGVLSDAFSTPYP